MQLLNARANFVAHVGSAVTFRLLDVDADGLLVVEERQRARLLRSVAHLGHIAKSRGDTVAFRHHELRELLRVLEASLEADRPFVHRTSHPSNGRGQILEGQRLHDLTDADAGALHPRRVELHGEFALHLAAHRHFGDASDRAQFARDRGIGETREFSLAQRRAGQRERDDRSVRIVELLDDRLLHLYRQVRALGGDRIAKILRCFGEILAELELDDDEGEAIERGAVDVLHAANGGDLLLNGIEDFLLHTIGRRARIWNADGHHRWGNVGELIGLELEEREQAKHGQCHHRHDGDQRLLDREIRDEHDKP